MLKVNLYRYEEANGVVVITPNAKSDTDKPSRIRLIAEEDTILTNGEIEAPVVDIALEEVELWREIGGENQATEEDYINALEDLGVSFNG